MGWKTKCQTDGSEHCRRDGTRDTILSASSHCSQHFPGAGYSTVLFVPWPLTGQYKPSRVSKWAGRCVGVQGNFHIHPPCSSTRGCLYRAASRITIPHFCCSSSSSARQHCYFDSLGWLLQSQPAFLSPGARTYTHWIASAVLIGCLVEGCISEVGARLIAFPVVVLPGLGHGNIG
jgi:hypothetical protein